MSFDLTTWLGLKLPADGDFDQDWAQLFREAFQDMDGLFAFPQPWATPPVITGANNGPSQPVIGYGVQQGFVLKRGRETIIDGIVSIGSISGVLNNSTNYLEISLPFKAAVVPQLYPLIQIAQLTGYTPSLSGVNNLSLRVNQGTSTMHLIASNGASAIDELMTAIAAGFSFRFSGRYWSED